MSLEPGSFGDDLICSLDVVDFEAVEKYDALSYCWGTAVFEKAITMNGRHGYLITKSLWRALQRVRQNDKAMRLWVDAVCIDQADRAEKSVQVANMGSLRRSAAGMCVLWRIPLSSSR